MSKCKFNVEAKMGKINQIQTLEDGNINDKPFMNDVSVDNRYLFRRAIEDGISAKISRMQAECKNVVLPQNKLEI